MMMVIRRISYFLILLLTLGLKSVHSTHRIGGGGIIGGSRERCDNEGEEVFINSNIDMKCFRCMCQNGFVECEKESCPAVDDCYVLVKKAPGSCCDQCKDCVYKGEVFQSGAEWSDPDDPCSHFKCVAGVVTESNVECYTPCANPLPPKSGQCCPTCLGTCDRCLGFVVLYKAESTKF